MLVDGRLLKLAREARGWTQKLLADVSGVAQSSVSKYEKGLRYRPVTSSSYQLDR